MKRYLILTILILNFLVLTAVAQDKTPNFSDKGKITDTDEKANNLFLAYQAAKYGREHKSADAMIFAAAILKTMVAEKISIEKETEGGQPDLVTKETKGNVNADVLLNEAKIFAKKDRNLLGRIAAVAKFLPDAKGALGGPKRAITEVKAFGTDVITVQFRGAESAVVGISGDGDTDLDLYVYDENGNLVASDTGGADDCKVRFYPKRNGVFKIKIKNLGNVYNRYTLVTN